MPVHSPDRLYDDTCVVELTPPGRGAVAVVLVAGPRAIVAVASCFRPATRRPLVDLPLGRIVLGRWGRADGEELIVCRRAHDAIEVHCHGGLAAVSAVMERLVEQGCRQITWREGLRLMPDPIQADAQIALAQATTARTAAILLDQFHGALRAAVAGVIAALLSDQWQQAAERIIAILKYRNVGLHVNTPWRVVLAGPPNVGKSSLINALAGYKRSIVSHEAGTTRDVVTTQTAIDGWPVQLADTAGLRAAKDQLESAGIALARSAVAQADLVVLVHDATAPRDVARNAESHLEDSITETACPPGLIHVTNKIDLATAARLDQFKEPNRLATSAVTGEGIAELVAAIGRTLVPAAPPAGAAVPFTPRQATALDSAQAAIDAHDPSAAHAALQPLLATTSRA